MSESHIRRKPFAPHRRVSKVYTITDECSGIDGEGPIKVVEKPSSMKLPTFTIETSSRVQSGFHGQCGHTDQTPFNECDQLSQPEGNRMSFLTVPSPQLRRPSTADVVIQKLRVERLDGGGLSVSGVVLAANCHLSLIIFGAFFLLAGLVLSYIAFADQTHNMVVAQAAGAPNDAFKKDSSHKQMQVIGPVFLIVGLLMLILGVTMYGIGRKIRLDEKDKKATISAMQLRQIENSFSQTRGESTCSPIHTFSPQINEAQPVLSLRRGSWWWIEPGPVSCPKSQTIFDQPPPYSPASRSETPNEDISVRGNSPAQYKTKKENGSQQTLTVQISYPLQNEEVSTFPDAFGVASFPVKFDQSLDLAGRRHSTTSNSSVPSISGTNVFEVQECPEKEDIKYQNNDGSQSPKEEEEGKTNIEDSEEDNTMNAQIASSTLETVINVTSSPSHVASNLPLSKNGVALPRLSRHSVSSRGDISST